MKKMLIPIILGALLALEIKYIDPISNYVVNILDRKKEVMVLDTNKYHKDASYLFVKETSDFTPYSYQDLLNIIYSIINNGWNSFTFYCPQEYEECISDIKNISVNDTLLTQINNYANPFNSFSTLQTLYDENGEITINVKVTNTGDIAGKDVVEVYYNPPYTNGGIEKSTANLIGYEKTNERTDRTGGRNISYGSLREGSFSLHEQKERQDQSTEMG